MTLNMPGGWPQCSRGRWSRDAFHRWRWTRPWPGFRVRERRSFAAAPSESMLLVTLVTLDSTPGDVHRLPNLFICKFVIHKLTDSLYGGSLQDLVYTPHPKMPSSTPINKP